MEGTLNLTAPDDMHVHLRDGEVLAGVCRYTSGTFRRALVMPNLTPPVRNGYDVASYRERIMAAHRSEREPFTPLMTFKVMPGMGQNEVAAALSAGALAGKLYPEGVTTNSQDGVKSLEDAYPVFEELERQNAVLCLHGETPGAFCMDREERFLDSLHEILSSFPKLRVVLEHVTTAAAVRAVENGPDRLAATVTVHHMMTTLDDVVGGMLNPHVFCKPIPKRPSDMQAIRDTVLKGHPRFFLGTDSAPHLVGAKECSSGCAGVFTAPVAMECLIEIFEDEEVNESVLNAFTSQYGADFYGLPRNQEMVTYVRRPCLVPRQIAGVVPFRAGQELRWSREHAF